MTTTLTSSDVAAKNRRSVHSGEFAKTIKFFAAGRTISGSMILQMMIVEVGMIIDEVILSGNGGGTAVTCQVGDQGDDDRYIVNATLSAVDTVHRLNTSIGHGNRISKSDDANPYYDIISIKAAAATASFTGTYILTVLGHMEPA